MLKKDCNCNMYNLLINKKHIYSLLSLVLIGIVFLFNLNGLMNYNAFALRCGLLLTLGLILVSYIVLGLELITYIIFCIEMLLAPLTIQFYTGKSYGLLSKNIVQLYYPQFVVYTFLYCIMFLSVNIFFQYSKYEEQLIHIKYLDYSDLNVYFNNFIAIIFTIVAFPRLSLNVASTERFSMLLPGHAWNQLAIIALIFNLPHLKDRWSVKLVYLFTIMWFLFNGERADITGLILGISVYSLLKNKEKIKHINFLKKVMYALIIVLFILFLNYLAFLRNGQKISFVNNIRNILVTPTTSDVAYIFNVVIDYVNKFPLTNGEIFKQNLLSIIPFYNNSFFGNLVSASYPYPGGEPWLAQPLLDWGILGLVIGSLLDFIILRLITLKSNTFFKMEYIAMLCLVPRAVWYGRSYTFTTLVFFVPMMYLMNRFIFKYSERS